MIAFTREALWRGLCGAGIAQGELPPVSASHAPWYVRAMLGVAGWIGALFLLGFVGVAFAFVFKSGTAALAVGAMCCAGAYAIFRAAPDNDFAQQFGLAVSFAGQATFVFGLFDMLGRRIDATHFFAVAGFEAALAVLLANFVHRIWSTLAAAAALGYALAYLGIHGAAAGAAAAGLALLWLNEHEWAVRGALWRPVGYGLALSLLHLESVLLFGHGMSFWSHRDEAVVDSEWILWIGPALAGAVLVYTVWRLLARQGVAVSERTGIATLAASGSVALVSLQAPGVASSLLILLLGFAGGNRVLSGIGVLALLGYLSHFYYSLQATLLLKSAVLAGTGIVLLALWAGMRLLFGDASGKEETHA